MEQLKKLTTEEQKEREETLATWHNLPNTLYIVTASGTLTPIDGNNFAELQSFREQDMLVDGADS